MLIKHQLTLLLTQALNEFGIDIVPIVEYPSDPKHGDYATNIALAAFTKTEAYRSPMEFAEKIVEFLGDKNRDLKLFNEIHVAKPGFINFWVSKEKLIEAINLPQTDKESKILVKGTYYNKKIIVEYTDPNPFKDLHIGHLYSNIIGESLCRIFEANGALVRRVDYYGDVGMHVAKSVWGIMQNMDKDSITIEELKNRPLSDRITYLGEGYALGSNQYIEDSHIADEIKDINYLVYMSGQDYLKKKENWIPQIDYKKYLHADKEKLYKRVKEIYEAGKDWSLENFENLYKRLGTKFDGYYPESIAGERGFKIVKEHIKSGIFIESEGAVIFPGESQGLHNRVFINKLGLPTYEAKELGLAPWKYEDFKYDLSFIVTASEIAGYFSVLLAALKKVDPELGNKTIPLLHGIVRLPQGKMSSRSGNVITVNWLLDEAKRKVRSLVSNSMDNKENIAEIVGIAAVKYAFLRSSVGKDIVFDLDDSISFEGNSGPYLQYTYARTQSVLQKGIDEPVKNNTKVSKHNLQVEERNVLRNLARFSEIVEESAIKYAPNVLCTYLFELAQSFNLFYQKFKILKSEETERDFRLFITERTGYTLKYGLALLGISSPERM